MSNAILPSIKSPTELKALSRDKLPQLAAEIRERITQTVAKNGGHLSSNLGAVEITIALHRTFNFPHDHLLFDVGHQCYTHKLLTGRQDIFPTLRQYKGMCGFPTPQESEYDLFLTGHASTSISSATGLAAAARMLGEKRDSIALIGDGSMGGGMCFEALNHAGHAGENVLVVLNDNDMAIGKTVGAITHYLEELRTHPSTTQIHKDLRSCLQNIPLIGDSLEWLQDKVLDAVKNHTGAAAVFEAMGFRYFGPFDGHNLVELEDALGNLSKLSGPRLLHIITRKGEGLPAATKDPEAFHSAAPFEVLGSGEIVTKTRGSSSYSNIFARELHRLAKSDKKIVAITAAMTAGTGMKEYAADLPEQFFDVGMAEAHSIPFAASMARRGFKPVLAIYSTFLQRGYDQIFHDVTLQQDTPVIFALDRAGLVGSDGPTHHGVFDIAYLRHLPNIALLAPRDGEELKLMLQYALELKQPCAIRYPRGGPASGLLPETHQPVQTGKAEKIREGNDGTIFAYGNMVGASFKAAEIMAQDGLQLSVVNARFAKPLDEESLSRAAEHGPVFTVEDHVLSGGFGSAVGEYLCTLCKPFTLKCFGIPDRYIEAGSVEMLHDILGLSPQKLAEAIILHVRG